MALFDARVCRSFSALVLPLAALTSMISMTAAADITLPAGQLVLDLGSADQWRNGNQVQSVASAPGNGCKSLSVAGANGLVDVSASGPGPAFLNKNKRELIGLQGTGDCGRVEPGGWLQFDLAGTLSDRVFTSVDLSLNVKGNIILTATVSQDGAVAGVFRLYTGLSIPPTLSANEYACAPGSDSDPDSDLANCRWPFSAQGDALRLTASAGPATTGSARFGVGGENSTSVFELAQLIPADGQIDCEDDNATFPPTEYLNSGEGANATVQCFRRPNLDGQACEAVDYSLSASCDNGVCGVRFLHALETESPPAEDAYEFICQTWWPTQQATFAGGAFVLPKTEQFFGPNELQGNDLDFCEGVTPIFTVNTVCDFLSGGTVGSCTIDDIETVVVPLSLDHQPTVPGNQVGCLLDERVRQIEDAGVPPVTRFKHYQMWVLKGDYRVSRAF